MRVLLAALSALCILAPASFVRAWEPIDACTPVWSPRDLPSRYHVNQNGYSRIPLDDVRRVFREGFEEWSRPCCSAWRATEAGLTTGVGEDGNNPQHIISFRETSWPRELGDGRSVLAVNLSRWFPGRRGTCEGLTADMIFNGANHTFGLSASRNVTDLLAVATHEQGHWLGLGHSRVTAATMYFQYTGEAQRNLHPDDEQGVCTLYPGTCNCTVDADCGPGEVCRGSVCEVPRCANDSDCAEGLACNVSSGACIEPPCVRDDECPGLQVCRSGRCRLEGDCPICAPCTAQADCGAAGICVDDGTGNGTCLQTCRGAADCPGNTACFIVQGENFAICANEDAIERGLCPADFVCQTEASPCDGVTCPTGQFCDAATGRCLARDACFVCEPCSTPGDCPGGDCVTFDGRRSICVTGCSTDTDCPGRTSCFQVGLQGGGQTQYCLNADAATAGVCPSNFACDDDVNLCASVRCPAGQTCDPVTGRCNAIPDASGPGTDADGLPSVGDCAVCATCTSDEVCGPGGTCTTLNGTRRCVFSCEQASDCPGNSSCFQVGEDVSICLNSDAGNAGICPDDYVCEDVPIPVPVGPGAGDAGETPTDEDTETPPPSDESTNGTSDGCACSAAPGQGPAGAGLVLLVLALLRRRRTA